MSDPGAVLLLGQHVAEPGVQPSPYRGGGIVGAGECDGGFEPAAVVAKLERGQLVQRVSGRFDGAGMGDHRRLGPHGAGGGVVLLSNVPAG